MSNIIIETKNLTKKFGDLTAVDNFSIKLESGKIYGFIGPNGAGKTTTMSLLMDLIRPTGGECLIKGFNSDSLEAKKLLGYSPEFPSFYSDMSCIDYMIYMGCLGGLNYNDSVKKSLELLKFMDLEKSMYKKVAKFSTGMKKKVGLAQAMIHDPEILLLDEPTANLDPTSRMELITSLKKLVNEKQLTLIISSHVLTELELIITDVIMINKGKLMTYGPLADVKKQINSDILIVKSSNNNLLKKNLKALESTISVEEINKDLKISSKSSNITKKEIIKIAYENDLIIDKISENDISLDDVYKNYVLEGGENK
jgi:ABC-2 type transport system ATP-binding protein